LKPFEYDYATRMGTNYSEFGLVKNDIFTQYDVKSFPNESDRFYRMQRLNDFELVGNENRSFFVNEESRVVIPPQYKVIDRVSNRGFRLAQATATQNKIIFLETGRIIDYPFSYNIEYINEKSKIIVVRNYDVEEGYGFGVVSTTGKELVPCVNYGVAVGDEEAGIFFVKKDNIVPQSDDGNEQTGMSKDTLYQEDKDWMMYGLDGQLLNKTPFRFPIDFNDGIGAGMQGDKFNLYRNDGTVLKPFLDVKKTPQNVQNMERSDIPNTFGTEGVLLDFNNIRRDPRNGFYALFYNQGLTPTAILTDKNGETLVNSGHYDGFSQFFGKYALVSANGMVGLIDTFGREVIAAQDMRNFKGNLMDSLELFNKKIEQDQLDDKNTDRIIDMPLKLYDSLSIIMPEKFKKDATYAAALWNLILDKHRSVMIFTANDVNITRLRNQVNHEFYYSFSRRSADENYWYIENVNITKNTISFTSNKMNRVSSDFIFHNFYQRNNRWEDIKIQEILNNQGENRWKMNDLIIKKVKALEKADIDCSNPEAFVTRVENNFLLTPEGIDFYFLSYNYNAPLEKISITWAELKPFLRMKME
jgi:WG containing repeat